MKTTRILSDEPNGPVTSDGYEPRLRVELHYEKGGMNFFTGEHGARGYYLAVRKIERTPDGCTRFVLFSGGRKMLIEPAARFSAAKLAALQVPAETIEKVRAAVLEHATSPS